MKEETNFLMFKIFVLVFIIVLFVIVTFFFFYGRSCYKEHFNECSLCQSENLTYLKLFDSCKSGLFSNVSSSSIELNESCVNVDSECQV